MSPNWPLKFSCSGGSCREVRYRINATNTCEIGMHLKDEPGGGPLSARVGGQGVKPVYDDWFAPGVISWVSWYLTLFDA